MSEYPASFERLIHELGKLPGVGPRSAVRMAFHLLKRSPEDVRVFSSALLDARSRCRPCRECFNLTEQDICSICSSGRRDPSMILVVEDASDVAAFERTHEYRGLYHVLGGTLSPLEGRGPQELNLDALLLRAGKMPSLKEVIVATDPTVEGDSTGFYIQQLLQGTPVKVTRLGRGLPSGADVEYADETTLLRALEGRREL